MLFSGDTKDTLKKQELMNTNFKWQHQIRYLRQVNKATKKKRIFTGWELYRNINACMRASTARVLDI